MYLVPSHQLEELRAPIPKEENIRRMAVHTLDADMRSVLERADLTEYEKARRYGVLLQKYLTHVRQGEAEKEKLNLFLHPPEPEAPTGHDPVFNDVIDNVAPRYKANARMLLSKMKQNGEIASWDERGTFIYKGKVINGSHVLDLVKSITQTHSLPVTRRPKGMDVFMKAMAELNVPSTVAGRPSVRGVLERLKNPVVRGVSGRVKSPTFNVLHKKRSKWLSL